MILFISFLIGIQIIYTLAASTAPSFVYPSCNSLVVKAAAEAALDQVNSNRKEGYVFGLQRIFDVRDLLQKNGDSLFYLTLDVVETDCHILSGKKWKECKFPTDHGALHGQCKVVLQYNGKSKNSFMYRYSCSLRTVSSSAISRLCPDCPRRGNPSEESYQETAKRTLAKFNAEINHSHYFGLVKVTKAMAWWVSGASEEVEYTIQETSCRKNSRVPDITKCPFLPIENAERGLCKGSVINKGMAFQEKVYVKCNFFPPPARGLCRGSVAESQRENKKYVDVKCKLFQHLPPVTDEQMPQPTSGPQEPQHPHPSPNIREASPKQKETVGRVIYHNPWSKHAVPEVQEPNPTSGPTLASPGQDASPRLAKPAWSAIPPFPRGFSQSDQCPGDILVRVYGLELPSRPQVEAS